MIPTIDIVSISKEEFEDPSSGTMTPRIPVRELQWFRTGDHNLYGVIFEDPVDKGTFNAIVLGRDELSTYRAIDIQTDFATEEAGVEAIRSLLTKHWDPAVNVYPQD